MSYILYHSELPAKNQEISYKQFQQILGSDYPGVALRPMQRLGVLTEVLPEFALIDSLVIRDFYHRYTVDEHSLRTIEHLQALAELARRATCHFPLCGRPRKDATYLFCPCYFTTWVRECRRRITFLAA